MGVLGVCGMALGQNALGGGHALDANLNALQGRINPRATGIAEQIRFNNAVIYGTAPDGKTFQGSLGYQAPNEFGARVGSDSLYRFSRDSFTSGLASAGIRGSEALRYQFALTTGQYVPGFLAAAPVSVPRGSDTATTSNSTTSSAALRSTADYLTIQASKPSLVGVRQDEWGAEWMAKASPLLGVSWVKTAESPLGTAPTTPVPGTAPTSVTPGSPATVPTGMPQATPPLGTPSAVRPESARLQPGLTGLETPAAGVGSLLDTTQVDTRVPAISTRATSALQEQLLTRFRDNFAQPTKSVEEGAKPAPETKSFDEQLEILHRRLRGEIETPKEKNEPKLNPDGTMPRPKEQGKPDKTRSGEQGAEQSKDSNLSPEMINALKKSGETKLDHLIADAPRPGNEHGDIQGYRVLMAEGEDLMAKGRYFDAEERFTRAIASQPRDAMARIGRVHAEIGAGLYLSAAANLRSVFAEFPEMVGTKYAANLLPGEPRATAIMEHLGKEEKKAESLLGRESALLLAYMGYQRGDDKALKQGLDDLDTRIVQGEAGMEDRTLLSVIKAAWTK
jgi:hypothetical protein